jgi:hypothetical protein
MSTATEAAPRKRHITKAELEAARSEIPTLVDPTDLAVVFDISRASVHQWSVRGVVPEPWRVFGRTPVWRYTTIEQWAKDTGRTIVNPR